jgi:hypothetical protein
VERRGRGYGGRRSGTGAGTDGAGPTTRLSRWSSQGRVLHGGLVVRGEGELDEAIKVFEDFGITLYAGLPILVDASLQGRLGFGDLVGMWRRIIMVEGVGSDVVEVSRVGRLPSLGKLTEILEYIILSMGPYPRTIDETSQSML